MANAPDNAPDETDETPDETSAPPQGPTVTHLLARSRAAKFRRAGIAFTSKWTATPLADMTKADVDRILEEPALESRLVTESEAGRYAEVEAAGLSEDISRAELVQYILAQRAQIAQMTERISRLEVMLTGDRPPTKRGDRPAPAPRGR